MPDQERERVLSRIAEIKQALRNARSEDLRETLRQALQDCERRLEELEHASH
jgi:hypothetical protein